MKAKTMKIVNFICAVVIALFAIGYAFAWFVQGAVTYTPGFGGSSAGAYFKSGSGTESDPYVIDNKYHLYNLAWLQNTGKLEGTHYYFELDRDLTSSVDMSGMVLPPIGNDEYPFTGVFNGNGKTIENLTVSTNKNVLTNSPLQSGASYEFSRAVGLFGMTGTDADGVAEISNFILKNPVVEVSDETKTAYIDTAYSAASSEVIGIAVGAVENNVKVSSIGVVGGRLLVRKTGYTTFNSILGSVADNSYAVTGGGYTGTGGSGNSFGASFDVETYYERLKQIGRNQYNLDETQSAVKNQYLSDKDAQEVSAYLPTLDHSEEYWKLASGEKLPFTVTDQSTYDGADAKEVVADNNIGYFTGNENKIEILTQRTFSEPLTYPGGDYVDWSTSAGTPSTTKQIPSWFYTYTNSWLTDETYTINGVEYVGSYSNENTSYSTGSGFAPLTEEQFEELPASIKNLLPEVGEKKGFTTIRLSQIFNNMSQIGVNTDKAQWYYNNQISYMGNTYGEKSDDVSKGIILPNNAIWFKPSQAGVFRFVMFASTAGDGFVLAKAKRYTDQSLSGYPFEVELTDSYAGTIETIIRARIPSFVLFYYEYVVTEEDLADNAEFFLQGYGVGGANFIYLDIGSSNEEEADQNRVDRSKNISAIDFVYDGVTIAQEEGDGTEYSVGDFLYENQLYVASQTSIYFEDLQNLLIIAFARSLASTSSVSFTVSYYSDGGAEELKATVSGKADLVPDEDNYYVSDSTGAIAVWTYG